jgi:four helix bundle protein
MFRFEKLDVWQSAVDFADGVYEFTGRFPDSERFGLTNQMRRAAISISSNIAEGTGRGSDADFARFVEMAYGSVMEVVSQAHIAKRQSMLLSENFQDLYDRAERLARMLSGLRNSLRGQGSRVKGRESERES